MKTLTELNDRLCQCQTPEELFGEILGTRDEKLETVSRAYMDLRWQCMPNFFAPLGEEGVRLAEEVTNQLNRLYSEAKARIEQSFYGLPYQTVPTEAQWLLNTATRQYRILSVMAEDAVSYLYRGEYDDANGDVIPVSIKIVQDEADNRMLKKEADILNRVKYVSLPTLVESFETTDDRAGLVLRYIDGLDVYAVRQAPPYREGLKPPFHIGWIMERQLSVLGFLHKNKVLHGNIEPGNIIVRSRDHNVFLIDFVFALDHPRQSDFFKGFTEYYSAPELEKKAKPMPSADIYSLGMSMLYLLGGDVENRTLPEDLWPEVASFIQKMIELDPSKRANDAWQLAHELIGIRNDVIGKPKFVELEL